MAPTKDFSAWQMCIRDRDIVAENELDDTATFFEVKRKAENIDMEKLEAKAGR